MGGDYIVELNNKDGVWQLKLAQELNGVLRFWVRITII